MIADAYVPSVAALLATAGALAAVTLTGFVVTRIRRAAAARSLAWALVFASIVGLHFGLEGEPPGFRMLALISATLCAMKAVVAVEARASGVPPLDVRAWLAFVTAWFGMQPRLFASRAGGGRAVRHAVRGAATLVRRGLARVALGLVLIALARWTWVATGSHLGASLLLLPGISFVLHFGLFNLNAALWRARGVPAYALFRNPIASRSLTEFWGRRWNLAFAEMTSLAVFRPLRRAIGPRVAVAAAFLFSGLLHELAISVPVGAGFGLPLAYFALHGGAMLAERPLSARGHLAGWRGRAWTVAWVVAPMPILFHVPFLRAVVWPLIGMV